MQVVHTRLYPSQFLNHALTGGPESELIQREVEPTSCDAKVGVVRGHVVDTVVSSREDDVGVLQPLHPGREGTVCVRPLVDLVGERDKEHERCQEHVAKVPRANLFWGPDECRVHSTAHQQQCQETVVTIGFNEVVPGNGKRVNLAINVHNFLPVSV